jgi:hypothetical protein
MHYIILLLRNMLIWPPNLRSLSQKNLYSLTFLLQNDLIKDVSFLKETCFQKKGEHLSPLPP